MRHCSSGSFSALVAADVEDEEGEANASGEAARAELNGSWQMEHESLRRGSMTDPAVKDNIRAKLQETHVLPQVLLWAGCQ